MQELSLELDALEPAQRTFEPHPGLAFAVAGLLGAALGLALFLLIRPDRGPEASPPAAASSREPVGASDLARTDADPVPRRPKRAPVAPVTTHAPVTPVAPPVAPVASARRVAAPPPSPPKPPPLTPETAREVAARVLGVVERYAHPGTTPKQLERDWQRLLRDGNEPAALEVARLTRRADRLLRELDDRIGDRKHALRKLLLQQRVRGLPPSERSRRSLELSRKRISVLERRRKRLVPLTRLLQRGLAQLRTPGASRARRRLLEARNAEVMRAWRAARRENRRKTK